MNEDEIMTRPAPGMARPMLEPLTPPHRPEGSRTHRLSVTIDQERYLRFKHFALSQGLKGDDVALIAIDRLMSGRLPSY